MAGIKGKGGVKGKSGGTRAGAGRKPKPKAAPAQSNIDPIVAVTLEPQAHGGALKRSKAEAPAADCLADGVKREPLEFLELVLNMPEAPLKDRIRAAIAAAQYKHTKRGDGGVKDSRQDAAKSAGQGKYKAAPSPLKLVNG